MSARSRKSFDVEAQDHDSFLDIVANIVGILIILVMVVSVRAKDAPLLSIQQPEQPPQPEIDLAAPKSTAISLAQNLQQMIGETADIDQLLAMREHERQAMATLLATAERQVEDHRQAMDEQQRSAFDMQRRLAETRTVLEKTELERVRAAAAETTVVKVDNYPTPISSTVFGKEAHFQLRDGRLAFIPLDQLVADAKNQARQKTWKLDKLPEATEMVGPRGGFRLRYTLEKVDLPLAMRLETGRSGVLIRAKRWELIPVDSQLGEQFEAAMAPGSKFYQTLAALNPKTTTITVWIYPDSFAEFRRLKKELYHRGFAAAGRPLPPGIPIAGSPDGSRSNAQ